MNLPPINAKYVMCLKPLTRSLVKSEIQVLLLSWRVKLVAPTLRRSEATQRTLLEGRVTLVSPSPLVSYRIEWQEMAFTSATRLLWFTIIEPLVSL